MDPVPKRRRLDAGDNEVITVNVGERQFKATRGTWTLMPDSVIATTVALHRTEDGEAVDAFLDVDPRAFERCLNYLRGRASRVTPPTDDEDLASFGDCASRLGLLALYSELELERERRVLERKLLSEERRMETLTRQIDSILARTPFTKVETHWIQIREEDIVSTVRHPLEAALQRLLTLKSSEGWSIVSIFPDPTGADSVGVVLKMSIWLGNLNQMPRHEEFCEYRHFYPLRELARFVMPQSICAMRIRFLRCLSRRLPKHFQERSGISEPYKASDLSLTTDSVSNPEAHQTYFLQALMVKEFNEAKRMGDDVGREVPFTKHALRNLLYDLYLRDDETIHSPFEVPDEFIEDPTAESEEHGGGGVIEFHPHLNRWIVNAKNAVEEFATQRARHDELLGAMLPRTP